MPTLKAEGTSKEVYVSDALPAGEAHVGQVSTHAVVIDVAPVFDTAALTANDVWFTTTEVVGALRVSGGVSRLVSLCIIDLDDQTAAAITLHFFRSNASLGTVNNAPDVDDTEILEFQGHVAVAAADFVDVGGSKVACVKNINLLLEATTGTSVWVAATNAGTPTNTAGGVKLRLGFEQY